MARDGSSKIDIPFLEDDKQVGEIAYGFIDEHENEYLEFVKARLSERFDTQYTKHRKATELLQIDTSVQKDVFQEQDKAMLIEGLGSLLQTLREAQQDF